MRTVRSMVVPLALFALVAVAGVAHAAPEQAELLQRMEARLPLEMDLKMEGKVGESNRALLQPRTVLSPAERALVNAQNQDRIALYSIIAQRVGSSLAAVQMKRAEDIRSRSPAGIWLQAETGEWYRKQ